MKTNPKFCSSRGDEAHSEKAESGKRKAEMNQRLLTSPPTVQKRVASGLCPDIFTGNLGVSGHRPDATIIANGYLATVGGQKEPKTEPDIIMSGFEIIKSVSDLIKSEPDITKSEADLIKSLSDITRSKPDIIKSVSHIIISETNITKSASDFTKSETNIIVSEPDFIRKMVKNRHLTRKRQKMGQFFSLNADFSKTGVAASRQRAASIITLLNAAVCRRAATTGEVDEAHFKSGNLKSKIGNDSETPHVVTCGILKRRKSQRLSCFPA